MSNLKLTQLHLKIQNEVTQQLAVMRKSIESITISNRSSQRRTRSRLRLRFCFQSQSYSHAADGVYWKFTGNSYQKHGVMSNPTPDNQKRETQRPIAKYGKRFRPFNSPLIRY